MNRFNNWMLDSMSGLREKQRRRREERILKTAMRLFARDGFEATHMERVAEDAEVSVGTLYNYHENKHDLLGALVRHEVETVLESGKTIVADPPTDLAEALNALTGNYAGHGLSDLTREMWRAAMGRSIAAPDSAFGRAFGELDAAIIAQIGDALAAMRGRGMVREDVDVERTARLIFDIMDRRFVHHVTSADEPGNAMHEDLAHAMDLLARAIGTEAAIVRFNEAAE